MNLQAIYHKVNSEYCFPVSAQKTVVRLRTAHGDFPEVCVVWHDKYRYNLGDKTTHSVKMKMFCSNSLFDFYEAEIEPVANGVRYAFKFSDEMYYGGYNFHSSMPQTHSQFFVQPYIATPDIFTVPSWAADAVIYQIFPDRFHTGGENLPPDWNDKVLWDTFRNGTLKGIEKNLSYLNELGINCIYLTPVFEAETNHRYDTVDYYKLDPKLGTKEDLVSLVDKAHSMGMRVVLDAVFNHSSVKFAPFADVVKNGAQSKYASWFDVRKYPVEVKDFPDYATFGYFGHMPKLMTSNPDTRDYLISAAEYWTKEASIDGWRIDVADEVDHVFWREFRSRIKKINPEILIVGEIWGDAASWLCGDQYDTVMNYPFMYALADILANKHDSESFFERLAIIRTFYQRAPWSILWNLIGSHDTPRFLFRLGGNKNLLKFAALAQMTLPGTPFIYYGDELAMNGGCDPDCRMGMDWEKGDYSMYEFYRKIISARKKYPALRYGEMERIKTSRGIIAYRLLYNDQVAEVIMNFSARPCEHQLDGEYTEIIKGTVCKISVTVENEDCALLVRGCGK